MGPAVGSPLCDLLAENDQRAVRNPHSPSIKKSGGVLLSQAVSDQVPSAQEGLTSVFGMGTGVTPPQWPPKLCITTGWNVTSGLLWRSFDSDRTRERVGRSQTHEIYDLENSTASTRAEPRSDL